jgi:hypothetical protein
VTKILLVDGPKAGVIIDGPVEGGFVRVAEHSPLPMSPSKALTQKSSKLWVYGLHRFLKGDSPRVYWVGALTWPPKGMTEQDVVDMIEMSTLPSYPHDPAPGVSLTMF